MPTRTTARLLDVNGEGGEELVGVLDGVALPEGVLAGVLEQEPTNAGAVPVYGALVTPRNTVFVWAVASRVEKSPTVLYEYSLVGEVTYNM